MPPASSGRRGFESLKRQIGNQAITRISSAGAFVHGVMQRAKRGWKRVSMPKYER